MAAEGVLAFLRGCGPDDRVLAKLSAERLDLIIGVNDGIVPASILALNLSVNICYWTVGRDGRVDTHGSEPDIQGRRVLLLSDQVLHGTSLNGAYARAEKLSGFSSAIVKRMGLFVYDIPTRPAPIDYEPPRKTSGRRIKMMPWSYTPEHKDRYAPRST